MGLHNLACNRGMTLVGPKFAAPSHVTLCSKCFTSNSQAWRYQFSSCEHRHNKQASSDEHTSRHIKQTALERRISGRAEEKFADRDFFLSILHSTSTKREAKSYLQRFKLPEIPPARKLAKDLGTRSNGTEQASYDPVARSNYGTDHGSFNIPAKAVEESPVFAQQPLPESTARDDVEALHLALVEIKAPQLLDKATLQGIGKTLTQLGRLGLSSVVVLDCENRSSSSDQVVTQDGWHKFALEQADRLVEAFEPNSGPGARRMDSVLGVAPASQGLASSVSLHSGVRILFKNHLLAPLKRGIIPVIAPIGYTAEQIAVPVCPDDVIFALAKEFAGLATTTPPEENPAQTAKKIKFLQRQISLDRLIILDPLGGIPSPDRLAGAHVYINMEQEFEDIRNELIKGIGDYSLEIDVRNQVNSPASPLGDSNPFSTFVETEVVTITSPSYGQPKDSLNHIPHTNYVHLRNLELLKRTLSLLPPTSSALLTTPLEAANSGRHPSVPFQAPGVGTRRQKNPLIHNLLTDKPIFSSSLPTSRLGAKSSEHPPNTGAGFAATTLVKRGMHLTIIPDPRTSLWTSPDPKAKGLTLEDPRIDLPRLVNLIEDSFNRKLDVQHYLSRVNSRLAGLIIAGEYEGGAILTWETPPACDGDGSEVSRQRLVPYLDKFAVLKRSQGSGGVADIVFKAMVADCFPGGVCWRSRRDNPVNKWYFERARGTWKIPNTNWTMFWTTENVMADPQKFLDYEGVCRTVTPSWADKKAMAD